MEYHRNHQMLAEQYPAAWDIASRTASCHYRRYQEQDTQKEDCETSHNDLLKIADELFISKPGVEIKNLTINFLYLVIIITLFNS